MQLDDGAMNQILASHLIGAEQLRLDEFTAFYEARKSALVMLVERAMKKSASAQMTDAVAMYDESVDEYEPVTSQS